MAGTALYPSRGRLAADTAWDIEDMLEHGLAYQEILAASQISHGGILKALKKAGRDDLSERMSKMREQDRLRLADALGLRVP